MPSDASVTNRATCFVFFGEDLHSAGYSTYETTMKHILIYRNPHCIKCERIARLHHAVDWFNRIADTTTTPPTGPLRMGEIVVKDLRTDRILRGAEGVRLVYRQAPAYWLLLPLLWIPPVRAWIDREVRGCNDGSCQIDSSENIGGVDHA